MRCYTMATHLFLVPAVPPMEARSAAALPEGPAWQYEPKWDGFRCLAYVAPGEVDLCSKAGKSLGRFFPEIVAMLTRSFASPCVVDGELIITRDGRSAFDALQARLHPAARRIARLSHETPARYALFDCLQSDTRRLIDAPLDTRRAALGELLGPTHQSGLFLSQATFDIAEARDWLARSGGVTDGVIAKRRDERYHPGERRMVKVKRRRSADCVVGGFRYASAAPIVGSLLLGLYDAEGLLDHVGFICGLSADLRADLTPQLERMIEPPGFTGRTPGGPSRWSTERAAEWQPLRPELVAEVEFDHVTGQRFRHGTRFVRWRPDKAPHQCTMEQLNA